MEVGDKVRVIQREHGHEFVLGGVGIIREYDAKANDFYIDGVDDYWWCSPTELEPVPQDEPITAVSRSMDEWED